MSEDVRNSDGDDIDTIRQEQIRKAVEEVPPQEPLTIAVVDDEKRTLRAISEVLRSAGAGNVVEAAAWPDACIELDQTPADVLLLDVAMPGVDGIEALADSRSRYPEMLVIMVTAASDASTAVKCMKLGAIDYLVKPVSPEALVDAINSVALDAQMTTLGGLRSRRPAHAVENVRDSLVRYHPAVLAEGSHCYSAGDDKTLCFHFCRYISDPEVYAYKGLTIEKVAAGLGSNRTYVSRMINSNFGMTFPQLLGRMRVAVAVDLIDKGALGQFSVAGLAATVGFSQPATFYRTFRSLLGKTPNRLRSAEEPTDQWIS